MDKNRHPYLCRTDDDPTEKQRPGYVSRWMWTATVNTTQCPKCGSDPAFCCQTPSGKKAWPPHRERSKAYSEGLTQDQLKARHSVPAEKGLL